MEARKGETMSHSYDGYYCTSCEVKIQAEWGGKDESNYIQSGEGPFCKRCFFLMKRIEYLDERVETLDERIKTLERRK